MTSTPATLSSYGILQQQVGKTQAKQILDTYGSTEIPRILTQLKLNTDPCIDDIEPQVENTSGTIKSIIIGLVIGFILLKLVK